MRNSYAFHTDNLKSDYSTTFREIEMYVNTQNIDEITREERLSELLDMFLSAQNANKPVQSIVGNNVEEFCKIFCSDCGIKNRILNILDNIKTIAQIMIVISILDIFDILFNYLDGTTVDFLTALSSLNVSGYLMGIVISMILGFVCNFIVRSIMFKSKHISMRFLKGTTFGVAVVSFLILFTFMFSTNTNLFDCPVWIMLLCGIVYLTVYYPFNYKRVKIEKSQKVRFRDLVNADMDKEFADVLEKKYAKANKRNLKKGKGELPIKDFLSKEEKDCNKTEKTKLFYYLFPLGITALVMIFEYFCFGFETYFDAIFLAVLLLVIEYAIMISFWKITKSGIAHRRSWINAKRKEISQYPNNNYHQNTSSHSNSGIDDTNEQ